MIKRLGGSVLIFEAIVIVLAIPVAINVAGAPAPAAIVGGLLLAVAAILVAARLDRPWGVPAGWVLQVLVLATALIVPVMALLGVIFGVLWLAALRLAQQAGPATPGQAAGQDPTTSEQTTVNHGATEEK